jgi:hypothetical protein
MKNISRLIFFAVSALCLPLASQADSHQVTGLTSTATAVIAIPHNVGVVTISVPAGQGAINITFDDGTSLPTTGVTGNGQPIVAGSTFSIAGSVVNGKRIIAILQTSTTSVVNICTDGPAGTTLFPTN